MEWRLSIAVALMGLALVAAGCGGSGDDSASGASAQETVTKAEFIKRADKICVQVDETQKKAYKDFFEKYPNANLGKRLNEDLILEVGLPPIQAEARLLDELPVPAGDEKEIKAIVDGIEEGVETAEEVPNLLLNLKSGAGPFTEVGKLANEYGLKACALPL